MYRQILVAPEDCAFQKILWRENPNQPLKIYKLNTVTYVTASAPYLATRVLSQLADDECHLYPEAAAILQRDLYVDDLLTGANSFEEALKLRNDLNNIAAKGGLSFRKWASNDPHLTQDLFDKSHKEFMSFPSEESIKILGISWNPCKDSICPSIKENVLTRKLTKRNILAEIASLYDPLGLFSPVVMSAKLIMQLIWTLKLSWNDPLPNEINSSWLEFKNELNLLNTVHFDRCTLISNFTNIQIHGFCDASERAYGACIYLRSTDKYGQHNSTLMCSKSRVAPIQTVTLPRLELYSALLLARLYKVVKEALSHLTINKQQFWSDSTITLQWIQTSPHILKTFIANRVCQIQEITDPNDWKHVSTNDNPAELPSRGIFPKDLLDNALWKSGPQWLAQDESEWPQFELKTQEIPELRKAIQTKTMTCVVKPQVEWFEKFSSFRTLIRVISYCKRFIHNANTKNNVKLSGNLSKGELDSAHDTIIKIVQLSEFCREINQLSNNLTLD